MQTGGGFQSGTNEATKRVGQAQRSSHSRRRLSDSQQLELTRLYADTDTPVPEISRRFGIAETSVYRVVQRQGVQPRSTTTMPAPALPRAAAVVTDRGRSAATGSRADAAGASSDRRAVATRRVASDGATVGSHTTGALRRFRVSFVGVRVIEASNMRDALRQAEALGATDVTDIVRVG